MSLTYVFRDLADLADHFDRMATAAKNHRDSLERVAPGKRAKDKAVLSAEMHAYWHARDICLNATLEET